MNNELNLALNAFRPELEARFISHMERSLARLQEKFGANLKGIANSTSYTFWSEQVRPLTHNTAASNGTYRPGEANYVLVPEKVAAAAAAFAEATVLAWEAKITAKLGELDSAKVTRMGGAEFNITGTRNGMDVRITQQMIVNVSSKGTLYNQFPALIYVNGKFTSAAKYAKL